MDIPLGVIPAGTLNHFARDVGGGRDVAQALRVLAGGYTLPVDVAWVNERHLPKQLEHRPVRAWSRSGSPN